MRFRRLLSSSAVVASIMAGLTLLGPSSAIGQADRPDPDAGSTSSTSTGAAAVPVPGTGPAPETATAVNDEATYRAAVLALSFDAAGPHVIEIIASFTMDDGVDVIYTGDEDLTINGNGNTVNSTVTNAQFLEVDSTADLTVNDLTLRDFDTGGAGGAIEVDQGGATVNDSAFLDNSADGDAGAMDVARDVAINRSTFSGNVARDGDGGAIDTSDGGSITVTDSTFSDNTARYEGGAIAAEADVEVVGSTFDGNESSDAGGAVDANNTVALTNSTVTGNTGASILRGDDVTLIHVTAAANTGPGGGGVVSGDADGTLDARGTTISNTLGGAGSCVVGEFATVVADYSFSDDSSCAWTGAGTGNGEGNGTPTLGALADNGGRTSTLLPLEGSIIIDVIPESDCALVDDQRDLPRPLDGDGDGELRCDVGAVELEAPDVEPGPPVVPEGPIAGAPPFTG